MTVDCSVVVVVTVEDGIYWCGGGNDGPALMSLEHA